MRKQLRRYSWTILAALPIASMATAGIVELTPGTIVYDVSLDSGAENVTFAYAWAGSVDSAFSATAQSSEFPFKVSVQGDQSYRRYLRAHGDWGYLYIYHDQPALVGAGEIVADSYVYDTSRAIVAISVLGGTAQSVRVNTYADQGQERYQSYKSQAVNAASGQVSALMVADSSVRVSVTADLRTTGGVVVTRSLQQTVDLSGGDQTITFEFDLSDVTASTLQGIASIPSAFDSIHNVHQARVYQGNWRYRYMYDNPDSFAIADLTQGAAYSYGETYLLSPYYRITHPYRSVTMPAGGTANRDYVINAMGTAHAALQIDGFVDNAALSQGQIWVLGESNTAAAGYGGEDLTSGTSGVLDLALPAGSWHRHGVLARFQDISPASYTNSQIQTLFYNQPAWSLAGGQDLDLGSIPMTTVQTDLIFDVNEPSGTSQEYEITQPFLYGYDIQYNPQGQQDKYILLNAWGSNSRHPTATLRVIGEPGTYQVYPRAYVYEPGNATPTLAHFPSFELSMVAGDTRACDPNAGDCPVQVALADGDVVLTFAQVDVAGLTTVTSSPVGPEAPENFTLYSPNGGLELYYYIQTTASFTGSVEVCFQYPEGSSVGEEQRLRVGHYDSTTGKWQILHTTSTDTNANIICAETTSFSPFALLVPDNEAPIADAGDDQSLSCLLPGEDVLITLDGSGSSDPDGDPLEFFWSESGHLIATGETPTTSMSPGTHVVSLQVSDGTQSSAPDTVTITLEADSDAPGIAVAEPLVLWPPDHGYRSFSLADCAALTQDACEPGLDIDSAGRILSIYSDEPDNGKGDGDTVDDMVIDSASTFLLRAERQGTGNGRVYGVTFEVEDSAGNVSEPETCFIHVPRCMSAQCQDVQDDGPAHVVRPPN